MEKVKMMRPDMDRGELTQDGGESWWTRGTWGSCSRWRRPTLAGCNRWKHPENDDGDDGDDDDGDDDGDEEDNDINENGGLMTDQCD